MNPLLLPPRLVLRALDDLHAIAVAAGDLNGRLAGLEQRADRIEAQLELAIEVAEGIERRGTEAIAAIAQVLEMGEQMLALGERAETRAGEVMEHAAIVSERAALVAESGAQVAAALPLLERAIELTEPLEGAVERLGRIVDRLPGGRRAAAPVKPSRAKPAARTPPA